MTQKEQVCILLQADIFVVLSFYTKNCTVLQALPLLYASDRKYGARADSFGHTHLYHSLSSGTDLNYHNNHWDSVQLLCSMSFRWTRLSGEEVAECHMGRHWLLIFGHKLFIVYDL